MALKLDDQASPGAREDLARVALNRAITAHYEGRDEDSSDALELALELQGDLQAAVELSRRREEPLYRPRYAPLSSPPSQIARRELPGAWLRGSLYPLWGLPFDLVELPLKGLLMTPGLGILAYPLTFLGYPYPVAAEDPETEPNRGPTLRVGLGFAFGFQSTRRHRRGGSSISGSLDPLVFFVVLNALPSAVYDNDWADRLEAWGHCGTWWWPWAARSLHVDSFHPERPLGSRLFPNARRVESFDTEVDRLRAAIDLIRSGPLERYNKRVESLNGRLLLLPASRDRLAVGAALAQLADRDARD